MRCRIERELGLIAHSGKSQMIKQSKLVFKTMIKSNATHVILSTTTLSAINYSYRLVFLLQVHSKLSSPSSYIYMKAKG